MRSTFSRGYRIIMMIFMFAAMLFPLFGAIDGPMENEPFEAVGVEPVIVVMPQSNTNGIHVYTCTITLPYDSLAVLSALEATTYNGFTLANVSDFTDTPVSSITHNSIMFALGSGSFSRPDRVSRADMQSASALWSKYIASVSKGNPASS